MSILGSDTGGYVFISHSHQDIVKVRQIRNAMEEEGFEPLCFYLKCLSDEDEIEDLIKREIDAREWFVYIDSPNARASGWVRKEREYIASLGSKQIITIDLEAAGSMQDVSAKLIRGLRVVILCGESDMQMAQRLQQGFLEKDMQTVLVTADEKEENRPEAKEAGCIVILMSQNGIRAEDIDTLLPDHAEDDSVMVFAAMDDYDISSQEDNLREKSRVLCHIRNTDSKLRLEEFIRRAENEITNDLRKAFTEASSHSEVESYYLRNDSDPEAAGLAEEAHDRLDEEQRIKDDLLEAIENGTMQMTDELKKFLES